MKLRITLAVLGMFALGGCAQNPPHPEHSGTSTAGPGGVAHHGAERGSMMKDEKTASMCPAQVAGTTTRAEHVPGGAALAFTTTGDVAELRRRVTQMADMHNRHHAADAQGSATHEEHSQEHGRSQQQGMHGDMDVMMAAQANVEEISGGARIVFVPQDAAQLDTLRAHVGKMAERMSGDGCPMMMEH